MQQFVVIASDGDDGDALDRRLSVRPSHLDGVRELKTNNNYILGGAILNEQGQMKGSVMIVQFETIEQLHEWLENEPYVKGEVWKKIEIKPFKVADV